MTTHLGQTTRAKVCRQAMLGLSLVLSLSACGSPNRLIPTFPSITWDNRGRDSEGGEIGGQVGAAKSTVTDIQPGPGTPILQAKGVEAGAKVKLTGAAKSIAVEQMPIPAFIETVFGQALGLSYQVDPQVAAKTETVTLRTGGNRSPEELLQISEDVLKSYGIRVVSSDNVLRIVTDQSLVAEIPQIIRGRTQSEVPSSLRPLFQVVFMSSVPAGDMQNWLINAFGKRVTITSFPTNGLLLISGLPDDVRAVMDAIRLLDQPRLAGRQSVKIEPVYWGVERLGRKLAEILKAEGYNVSAGGDGAGIILIPVETINLLLVFSADPAAMSHVMEWTRDLDRPAQADPLKKTFIYPVVNTTAESLGEVLGSIVGGTTSSSSGGSSSSSSGSTAVPSLQSGGLGSSLPGQSSGLGSSTQGIGATSGQSGSARGFGGGNGPRIVVDPLQNAIIFMGTAEEYAQVIPLLKTLDKAPRIAMIEVTVAEVTLKSSERLGIEWALSLGTGGGGTSNFGTAGGLGVGSTTGTSSQNGFNFSVINSAATARAILNAFASDNRVNILLTPRLLTRSGTEAQIKVGNEVPIITSQANSPITSGGTTSILNQITYRTTGTLLRVKPIVHSGDRIDIDVSQEVSEAQTNDVSSVSSPLIFSRSIVTKLSLKDGATVLLGGLIQENRSSTTSAVPWLGEIPGLGNLFRNQSTGSTRTELLIFITPYIVKSAEDSENITQQFEGVMQNWPRVDSRVRF